MHSGRPPCPGERAREYDAVRRERLTKCNEKVTSLQELDPIDTRITGDLVDFARELTMFPERLHEPTVGTFMDTRASTKGDLYTFREYLHSTTNPTK